MPADARFILSAANMHLKLGQPAEACELYKKLESLSLTARQSEIARSKQRVAASMTPTTPREDQAREAPAEAPGRPGPGKAPAPGTAPGPGTAPARGQPRPGTSPPEAPGRPGPRSGASSQLGAAVAPARSSSGGGSGSGRSSSGRPEAAARDRCSASSPGDRGEIAARSRRDRSSASSPSSASSTPPIASGRAPPTLLARLGTGSFAAVWRAREASGK